VKLLSLPEFQTSQKRKSIPLKLSSLYMSTFHRCIEYSFALFKRPAVHIDLVVTENAVSMYKSSNIYIKKNSRFQLELYDHVSAFIGS
jgi:hypothetical protein